MGIDWEGILGAEGDDLADAYIAAVPEINYNSYDDDYDHYADYEKKQKEKREKIKAAYTFILKSGVKITYVDHYNQHYTVVDGYYSFYPYKKGFSICGYCVCLQENDKRINNIAVTRSTHAAADYYEYDDEYETLEDEIKKVTEPEEGKPRYICINSFSVEESKLADAPKPASSFDDIEGVPEFKDVDINEYESFSSELCEEYKTTRINFKAHEYYDEDGKHFIHIIRDTQTIRYDENYDEEENYGISSFRNEVRFCNYRINDKDVVCFDNNYIALKNGSDEICVNRCEYAHHYDKNGDEIFRLGDYELAVHEKDCKKTGRINGIECDNVIYTKPFPICPKCPTCPRSFPPSKSTYEFDPDLPF